MACDCDCKMLNTLQTLIRRHQNLERSTKGQDDILEQLRDLAVLQRERITLLERRISALEDILIGIDDEEECECGCNG